MVHYKDLGGIPDEFKSSQRIEVIEEAHANAQAMVAWSQKADSVGQSNEEQPALPVPRNSSTSETIKERGSLGK